MFSVVSFKIELNIFFVILYFCRDYAVKKFEDYSKNKSPKSGGQSAIEIILNVCHIAHHTEEGDNSAEDTQERENPCKIYEQRIKASCAVTHRNDICFTNVRYIVVSLTAGST